MTDTVRMLEDPIIGAQLDQLMDDLVRRLALLGIRHQDGVTTQDLTAALRGDQSLKPMRAAKIILTALVRNPGDPAFWASPLGRAVAFWGTGVTGSVTRACAAAALGCSRQNVALMLRSGRLSEPVDAGTDDLVSTSSLAHAMRVQAAREV